MEQQQNQPVIRCTYTKLVDIDTLVGNPLNANTHSDRQIELYAKILKTSGVRKPIIVSNQSGFVNTGHGAMLAAKKNGWTMYPVDYQDFENEAAEYANMIADNKLAELAEHDDAKMLEGIKTLGIEDMELLGLDGFEFPEIPNLDDTSELYTKKIVSPIYEITGDKPEIEELYDENKVKDLVSEIEKSNIDAKIKKFLIAAAQRHIVFNYAKIAEFYAHADYNLQNLMEKSALVIIDFDKAIENGFVKLSEELQQSYLENNPNEEEIIEL
jgi:hypothetical protein